MNSRNHSFYRKSLVLLTILLLFISCMNFFQPSKKDTGSIRVLITEKLSASKSLLPSLDMTPASYTIKGSGPAGASFTQKVTGTSATISNLVAGAWSIIVEAYNGDASPTLIGSGTGTVAVTAGKTESLGITVIPLSGNGSLSLTVSWPSGVLSSPTVEASLTPTTGGSAQSLSFTIIADNSASYSSDFIAGYYTLSLCLKDGGVVVGGKTDTVRIIKGELTTGSYTFSSVNNPGTISGVSLTITPSLADPYLVSITGGESTIITGTTLNLTATVSNADASEEIEYAWYVNGVDQGVSSSSWSCGSSWAIGYYQIDVVAISEDGTRAGSEGIGVNVYGLLGGAIQGKALSLTGEVTTLAGSGWQGYTNGIGTLAAFSYPYGITTDGKNLYVADKQNNIIRKIIIDTSEVITIAGNTNIGCGAYYDGVGTNACFYYPGAITTDGTNLYVADTDNNRIRKIVIATGEVTTLAGSTKGYSDGTGSAAQFDCPTGITTDGTNLYVADYYNHRIRKIVISTGEVTTLAGSSYGYADGTGIAAQFYNPYDITTEGTNLYVSDMYNHRIRKIVISTGEVTTLAGSSEGHADGTGTSAQFDYPRGITTDGTNLYVADTGNGRIRKIVISTGEVTTLAGSSYGYADGNGTAAQFDYPYDITTDGINLYVTDTNNNRIRCIK